jgi:hypothetical protein
MRTCGGTEHKMEVGIERDLEEIICETMNSAGSSRIQWRIPEKTVITFFRFRKERRLFSSRTAISFSNRPVLQRVTYVQLLLGTLF